MPPALGVPLRVLRLVCAPLLALVLTAPRAHASPENPETTAELVSAVKAAYTGVSSVRADFTQTVHNATMGTDEKQKGKISLEKPRKIRVEVGQPAQSMLVSDGKTLWVYNVASKSVLETPEVTEGSDVGTLLDDLTRLDELFTVTVVDDKAGKTAHVVKLVPRKAGNYKSIQLTLSKQKYQLQELVLTDQLDNVTEMDFVNLRFNQDVPDSDFVFVAPAGVQVIKSTGL